MFISGWDTERDIYQVDPDGMNLLHLAIDTLYEEDVTMSRDGAEIFFAVYSGLKWNIYHIHSDGSGILNLTNNNGINHEPQLSPDESEIVFTSCRDLKDGLFMMVRDTLF